MERFIGTLMRFPVSNTISGNTCRVEIRSSVAPVHEASFFNLEVESEFDRPRNLEVQSSSAKGQRLHICY